MKILVLNPNSSAKVTEAIAASIAPLQAVTKHTIVCDRLPDAPIGIETDEDVALVAPMVVDAIAASDADAFVVACFSDPGVAASRSATNRPVVGIAEAAYYAALQLAPRFGVVSLGASSVARHAAHIERLGLTARLAADRAVNMSVAEANDLNLAGASVARTAKVMAETDGAGVVILGCAGMGGHRPVLQQELGVPVVDPVQAAVAAAINALDLQYFAKG
jgi:Asp/Glu/hydantoin racemase